MKVHVVEDEAPLLRAIEMALTKNGYKVTTSKDGDAAFGEITTAEPELVVMDLLLPGKHGLEIIEELRNNGYAGKIIIFTNDTNEIKNEQLTKLQVSSVLVKSSVKLSQLLDEIKKV